ncbi:alpha/beta hydrolase [Paenibacillus turpanensis]|uniref:alpha/beta hydrolase n=1 Tax=Paenibacillus turpanensis TaxID=2689078 RepID=UPI001FB7F1C9|nr:alpha/beta hydrolase-fold protein [Paenibacillus turpanensis]
MYSTFSPTEQLSKEIAYSCLQVIFAIMVEVTTIYLVDEGGNKEMSVTPVSFFSGALYERKTCFVYLPPSYEETDQAYPVIYLLHGMYGSELDWNYKGNAGQTLDHMISEHRLRECIVVMPSDGGYGHGTYYMDWYDGTGNFEEYLISDLVPFIDNNYRTLKTRDTRVIAGLSMGGFGAFLLSLRNPDLFGAAASLSGALGSAQLMPQKDFDRSEFSRIIGPRNGIHAMEHDLNVLTEMRMQDPPEERPSLYFDCGTEDYLYPMNAAFRNHLQRIGYTHEYQEFSGQHDWNYWTSHLPDTLMYFERYFSLQNGK